MDFWHFRDRLKRLIGVQVYIYAHVRFVNVIPSWQHNIYIEHISTVESYGPKFTANSVRKIT